MGSTSGRCENCGVNRATWEPLILTDCRIAILFIMSALAEMDSRANSRWIKLLPEGGRLCAPRKNIVVGYSVIRQQLAIIDIFGKP